MKIWTILALLIGAAIGGCSALPLVRPMYDGASLPPDRVATIQLPPYAPQVLFSTMPAHWLEVRFVDGRSVRNEDGRPAELHVLPGVRRLTVRAMYETEFGLISGAIERSLVEDRMKQFERELILDALAARTYALRYRIRRPGLLAPVSDWQVDYWIEDLASGGIVAGEKP